MTVYLDTSALVKLVVSEPETRALRDLIATDPNRISCALAEVELMRVAHRGTVEHVGKAREVLDALSQISLGPAVLRVAANLLPGSTLRSLDAIHLAAASAVPDLTLVVTYDRRMTEACAQLGIHCAAPA